MNIALYLMQKNKIKYAKVNPMWSSSKVEAPNVIEFLLL